MQHDIDDTGMLDTFLALGCLGVLLASYLAIGIGMTQILTIGRPAELLAHLVRF